MRVVVQFSLLVFLLSTCVHQSKTPEKVRSESYIRTQNSVNNSNLTPEQNAALDAMNKLQANTDEKNHFYSTFAGIEHPCYPPDTSFTISQAELLAAMNQFVESHCKELTKEERDKLAASMVLAQEEYIVAYCLANATNVSYKDGIPRIGTWIMPGILGRRDVIIAW
ncbi:MAG: hypothetical protein AAGA77_21520 [Bacteroidota bacterium]